MNTLRGIFPEPQRPPRRNFLKENVVSIKQKEMAIKAFKTGYAHGLTVRSNGTKRIPSPEMKNNNRIIIAEKPKMITVDCAQNTCRKNESACCRKAVKIALETASKEKYKSRDASTQTEASTKCPDIIPQLSSTKSPVVAIQTKQKPSPPKQQNEYTEEYSPKKDFIKENAQLVKMVGPTNKVTSQKVPINPPPDYKRGVVPKYIKERKEELYKQAKTTEGDEKCPEGHVLLPDNERKETLRMFKQSYAELITELNNLPVRSDTLKVRNRKIDIEKQLKKLDEGIKVFSRPKVYVKIGA